MVNPRIGETLIPIRVKTNFAINLIGMVAPFAITLITVPIYISKIGADRYGILSIIWVLLGYFGLLDFGLARATANTLARFPQISDVRARILMTSLYLNLWFGIAAGIVLYLVGGPLLHHILTLSDALNVELESGIPWLAGMVPLALIGGVGTGALESRERFFAINVLDIVGVGLGQILPVVSVILYGPSLKIAIPAIFAGRALSVAVTLGFVAFVERPSILVFDKARVRELLEYGMWLSVTNVISPLMTSIDRFFLGATAGVVAVAHYSVAMNLAARSQIVANALARTLFPRFSRLDRERAYELVGKSAISLAYGYGAIAGPLIILGRAFMTLWLGSEFASYAAPAFEILIIGAWINGIALVPYSFLQGQRRPDLVAKLHASEFLPYIAVLWILVKEFGLVGAAVAWCCRVACDAALLFKFARLRGNHLLRLIPPAVLLVGSYAITKFIEPSPIYSLVFAGTTFVMFVSCAVSFDVTLRESLFALSGAPRFLERFLSEKKQRRSLKLRKVAD